jgi:poly(3-hydroxybutyrate) depolymerase
MEAAVAELEGGSIEVAGVRRTYWVARAPRVPRQPPGVPLLIVLHGSGPQFLRRIIGRIPRHLDATGILLAMAEREDGVSSGRRTLGPDGQA